VTVTSVPWVIGAPGGVAPSALVSSS
jgi:hypothetical protein